jgi:hypothetical protein
VTKLGDESGGKCWGSLVMAFGVGLAIVPGAVRPSAQADTAWADDGGERVPEDVWQARTNDYLEWATAQGLAPGSIPSVLAHAERHDRDPSFAWDANAPDPSDYEARFQQLREFRDTGDFAINDYLFTLLGHRDQLDPTRVGLRGARPRLQVLVDRTVLPESSIRSTTDREPSDHLSGQRVHRRADVSHDRSPTVAHRSTAHGACAI